MKSKKIRMIIMMFIDILIVMASSIGALALRFDISSIPTNYYNAAIKCLPADIVIAILVLWLFHLYNRVWTYASVEELVDVLKATVIIEVIYVCYRVLLDIHMPRSFYFLDFGMIFFLFCGLRMAKRMVNRMFRKYDGVAITRRVMVIGAGAASSILIKELTFSESATRVVCIIDDNPNKKGAYIHSIPIVGNRFDIAKSIEKFGVSEIIIAMPSAKPSDIKEVVEICNATGVPLKILPSVAKSLTGNLAESIREVRYEDLLGRDAIEVDMAGINEFLHKKTVLVTGGGGSIGSELARQIMSYDPKLLIIFDIYENCVYDIQNELKKYYPNKGLEVLIGSVRDYDRLEEIFKRFRPNVVYHAAAHKHVPLMEDSPNEAIKNNCLGTYNVAKLANEYKADNFILISTDKAVRPTNIMGASKRICEMIIQTFASQSKHTRYAAVRFGNVLGSNGSVIPLFLKQIENGGPVTVTDERITRFFMTIPEAVALVLQASLFAKGGEIFVLDMGQPVRIYELAENLIRMKGYVPNKDIMIKVVGLRPGEKLYEELLMDEEGLEKTDNQLIYIGKPIEMDRDEFAGKLAELIDAAEENDIGIKYKVKDICEEYRMNGI